MGDILYEKNFDFDLPWKDSAQWEMGKWYPVPVSECSDISEVLGCSMPNHWDIFKLQEEGFEGDVEPVLSGSLVLSFQQALELCESHNGKILFEREVEGER